MEANARTRRARFAAFEVDLRSGELHKHGIRLKLQDQPFQVLALLLEHPGDVVTREELRQKLWPADTFVDFDTGLNSAIKKLRDVLCDSAQKPRYIETLPRRGYRFIARVENGAQPAPPAAEERQLAPTLPAEERVSKETRAILPAPSALVASHPRWIWAVALGGVAVAVALAIALPWRKAPESPAGGVTPDSGAAYGSVFLIARPSANREANELLQRATMLQRFQSDPQRARPMLERALQLDPHFTEARAHYALSYIAAVENGVSNDPADIFRAEEELRRVVKEDPEMARGHAFLGAVHFFQGRGDLAQQSMQRAAQIAPKDVGGAMWRLIYGRFIGNTEESMRIARGIIESEPLFWPPRYFLGELLREQGKTADAVREQKRILEQDPANIDALYSMARTYIDAGNRTLARQTLERVLPEHRRNFRIRMVWAQLHALEGKRTLALKEMDEEVLKYADLQPFAALDAAEVYAVLGETAKAIEWLDRSMRKGDGRVDWIRRDPLLAGIREHPRFAQILASMQFRRPRGTASSRDLGL